MSGDSTIIKGLRGTLDGTAGGGNDMSVSDESFGVALTIIGGLGAIVGGVSPDAGGSDVGGSTSPRPPVVVGVSRASTKRKRARGSAGGERGAEG